MNSISAIIVDDEPGARLVLKQLILQNSNSINVVSECSNLIEAVREIKEKKPNVVFLDVQMPKYAGYEIGTFFDEINFEIIFVTAYDKYAIRAFELNAMDYIVKPIERSRLASAINKLEHKIDSKRQSQEYFHLLETIKDVKNAKLIIPEVGDRKILDVNDIIYIEADGSYAKFYMQNQEDFVASKTLKYFEKRLNDLHFFRVHRTFLVNVDFVESLNKKEHSISLSNGKKLKIARGRIEEFEKALL